MNEVELALTAYHLHNRWPNGTIIMNNTTWFWATYSLALPIHHIVRSDCHTALTST